MVTATKHRACYGKRRHASRDQADRHLQRLAAEGGWAPALTAYRCRHCALWHVGHRPGSTWSR